MAARGMSERRRILFALQGITFPRAGMRGRYIHPDISMRGASHRPEAEIEVITVTASGKTCLVCFVDPTARKVYDTVGFYVYRRGDGVDGSGWYLPSVNKLPGEVVFSAGANAALPWRLK